MTPRLVDVWGGDDEEWSVPGGQLRGSCRRGRTYDIFQRRDPRTPYLEVLYIDFLGDGSGDNGSPTPPLFLRLTKVCRGCSCGDGSILLDPSDVWGVEGRKRTVKTMGHVRGTEVYS